MWTRRGFLGALTAVLAVPRSLFAQQPLTTLGLNAPWTADDVARVFNVPSHLIADVRWHHYTISGTALYVDGQHVQDFPVDDSFTTLPE